MATLRVPQINITLNLVGSLNFIINFFTDKVIRVMHKAQTDYTDYTDYTAQNVLFAARQIDTGLVHNALITAGYYAINRRLIHDN